MTKVLCTDLDGTLFYPRAPFALVNKKNREFLRDFIAQGNRVAMVSSRNESFLEKVKHRLDLPLDYIGTDGTVVNINGKTVLERVFDPEGAKQLIAEIRREYDPGLILLATKEHASIMTRTKVNKVTNVLYFLYEAFQGAYREPWIRSDHFFYSELAKGQVRKMMVLAGLSKKDQLAAKGITADLAAKYPDFEFAWLNQFIEITPKGCSKASGVAFYLDYLGLNQDNVVVVGDSGNDVPMFEAFHEHSYCMEHARPAIKEHAAHVISRVSDLRSVLCPSVDNTPSEKEG